MAKRKATAAYVRVSTDSQNCRSQVGDVRKAAKQYTGPVRWYRDTVSGAADKLPALDKLTRDVAAGKVQRVIVWALDRISRKGIRDGLTRLQTWLEHGAEVASVQEPWVSATADPNLRELLLSIAFWGAAQERKRLSERTKAGLRAARAEGRVGGRRKGQRPKWALSKRKVDPQLAQSLRNQGVPVKDIAARFGCSKQGVYSALTEQRKQGA